MIRSSHGSMQCMVLHAGGTSFVSHTYFFVFFCIRMTIASFLVPKCLHTQLELTIDGCLDTCRARARARARAKGDKCDADLGYYYEYDYENRKCSLITK